MSNRFHRHIYRNTVMVCLLSSLTLSTVCPANPIVLPKDVGLEDVVVLARLEKLVEKLINSKNKSSDKIIDYVVDIKNEIELSFGIKFDLDKCFNDVEKELKANGISIPKKYLK
jgi:hypothetical protein